jgi:hypothetical protein
MSDEEASNDLLAIARAKRLAAESAQAQEASPVQAQEPEVESSYLGVGFTESPAPEFSAGGVTSEVEPELAPEPVRSTEPVVANESQAEVVKAHQEKAKRWAALLNPSYWDSATSNLLRPVKKGGLCRDVGVAGDIVTFVIEGHNLPTKIKPPTITVDFSTGSISSKGAISVQAAAAAFIEIGKSAGYKQMYFEGSPDFMRAAAEIARANGIEVISKAECLALNKIKSREEKAVEAQASKPAPAKMADVDPAKLVPAEPEPAPDLPAYDDPLSPEYAPTFSR